MSSAAKQYILIDLNKCKLELREETKTIKTYPVAVGTKKTPSPVGIYQIINKAHWGGAFGTRWMQLSVPWGTYGVHGTNNPGSIGQHVSHGCIRMHNRNVEELYDLVEVGTEVRMEGPVEYRLSVNGSRGNLVLLIQQRLQQQGYYHGQPDGIFTKLTEDAVGMWQKANNLPVTRQVDQSSLACLDIIPSEQGYWQQFELL